MLDCYVTFRSITRAQSGERLLNGAGIRCQLLRAPKRMAAQGCGYALRVPRAELNAAVQIFRQNEVVFQRVYCEREGGVMEEVPL